MGAWAAGTEIHRLRLRLPEDSARDAETACRAVRRWLAAADLQPHALPPAAILLVRHLEAALPPRLERDPARAAAAASRVRDTLEALARRAARPALAPPPADADSVFFSDRAELLACLAEDWLRGAVAERWWWRVLFRRRIPARPVEHAFLASPESIPAAVAHLERWRLLEDFARRLPTPEARRLLAVLCRAYALEALERASAPLLGLETTVPALPAQPGAAVEPDPDPPAPPWSAVLPSLPRAGVPAVQQLFAAVAVLLAIAPARLRGAEFAARLSVWADRAAAREAAAAPPEEPVTPRLEPPPSPMPPAHAAPPAASPGSPHAPPPTAVTTPAIKPPPTPPPPAVAPSPEPLECTHPAPLADPPPRSPAHAEPPSAPPAPPPSNRLAPETPAPQSAPEIVEAPLPPRFLHSGFCGVFFLLNAALALELYPDFTRPLAKGLELSPWDLLALLGRGWIGEEFEGDALWKLFAALAGREADEPPGASFVPPAAWKLPEEELPWEPCTPRVWLQRLETCLAARLRRALGWDDPAMLCRRPGRVLVSAARVDVWFDLAAHPVEIRLAGLDRDTGWIPAAGRAVFFHFE